MSDAEVLDQFIEWVRAREDDMADALELALIGSESWRRLANMMDALVNARRIAVTLQGLLS